VGLLFSLRYLFKLSFLRLYLSWALLYVFSLAVLNVPLFTWYYVLAFSVIPIFLVVGLYSLWNLISKRLNSKPIMVYLPVIVLFGLVVFEANGIFNLFCSKWYSRHIPHLERYETYMEVSNYIKKNISKEKSIATEEIGILGYSIENKIWDFHGLVHDVRQYPHYLPLEDKHRLPYLLTLMDPDYLLLHSFRLKSHEVFQNYREIKVFKVNEFKGNPGFYFSLLKKRHDQLVVLGDVQVNETLSGHVKLRGWAFATAPIESVEVLVNEQIVSRTTTFYASPPGFINLFKHNQFAKQSVFYLQVDTTQMANGTYELVFRASTGPKTGVFRKIKVIISNPGDRHIGVD
jgi:dTDP-4-dehydrorhamnose 3,5-epimerase-like enzyme